MKGAFAFLTLMRLLCLYMPCSAIVTKVGGGSNSIHIAISNAHAGDTLLLQSGIFHEHDIAIQKRITILGNGSAAIDAENKFQAFFVYHDSVTIQGVEIRNIGRASISDMAGIRVVNAKYVTIIKN